MEHQKPGVLRLLSSIILAAAILIGCGILANSFANNYYSSEGGGFPSDITARIDSVDSDYLDEFHALNYLGIGYSWELFQSLIDEGKLDGTFVAFEVQEVDNEFWDGTGEPQYKEGVIRVFSKARLTDWMEAEFAKAGA